MQIQGFVIFVQACLTFIILVNFLCKPVIFVTFFLEFLWKRYGFLLFFLSCTLHSQMFWYLFFFSVKGTWVKKGEKYCWIAKSRNWLSSSPSSLFVIASFKEERLVLWPGGFCEAKLNKKMSGRWGRDTESNQQNFDIARDLQHYLICNPTWCLTACCTLG